MSDYLALFHMLPCFYRHTRKMSVVELIAWNFNVKSDSSEASGSAVDLSDPVADQTIVAGHYRRTHWTMQIPRVIRLPVVRRIRIAVRSLTWVTDESSRVAKWKSKS